MRNSDVWRQHRSRSDPSGGPLLKSLLAAIGIGVALPAHADRAFELLKQPTFRSAYYKALGSLKAERWLAELPGPSSEGTAQSIEGKTYMLADSCRPHACNEENLIIAYAKGENKVYVLLKRNAELRVLGGPSEVLVRSLTELHTRRFGG